MALNIKQIEIDLLWKKGYRPFEIYVCNDKPELYFGKMAAAGSILGWDIRHVFCTPQQIKNYPLFDCIIGMGSVAYCTEIFHNRGV